MPDTYYQDNLYPFQDEILESVSKTDVDFYLTGGTALSRFHLGHRYSDDLDFFINNAPDFKKQVERVIITFQKTELEFEISTASESFARLFLKKDEVSLKVDFVNDVYFHYGALEETKDYGRIDNWRNILSNKLCALSRYEPKDIADIICIAKRFPFLWEEIIKEAREKDLWVEPLEISKILIEFPASLFKTLKWIKPVNTGILEKDLEKLHHDIFYGKPNSLALDIGNEGS